jgi:hypothetical protein
MAGNIPEGTVVIEAENQLPPLGEMKLALYRSPAATGEAVDMLMAELRCAYCC